MIGKLREKYFIQAWLDGEENAAFIKEDVNQEGAAFIKEDVNQEGAEFYAFMVSQYFFSESMGGFNEQAYNNNVAALPKDQSTYTIVEEPIYHAMHAFLEKYTTGVQVIKKTESSDYSLLDLLRGISAELGTTLGTFPEVVKEPKADAPLHKKYTKELSYPYSTSFEDSFSHVFGNEELLLDFIKNTWFGRACLAEYYKDKDSMPPEDRWVFDQVLHEKGGDTGWGRNRQGTNNKFILRPGKAQYEGIECKFKKLFVDPMWTRLEQLTKLEQLKKKAVTPGLVSSCALLGGACLYKFSASTSMPYLTETVGIFMLTVGITGIIATSVGYYLAANKITKNIELV